MRRIYVTTLVIACLAIVASYKLYTIARSNTRVAHDPFFVVSSDPNYPKDGDESVSSIEAYTSQPSSVIYWFMRIEKSGTSVRLTAESQGSARLLLKLNGGARMTFSADQLRELRAQGVQVRTQSTPFGPKEQLLVFPSSRADLIGTPRGATSSGAGSWHMRVPSLSQSLCQVCGPTSMADIDGEWYVPQSIDPGSEIELSLSSDDFLQSVEPTADHADRYELTWVPATGGYDGIDIVANTPGKAGDAARSLILVGVGFGITGSLLAGILLWYAFPNSERRSLRDRSRLLRQHDDEYRGGTVELVPNATSGEVQLPSSSSTRNDSEHVPAVRANVMHSKSS
jgi:hypothetical protein